MATRSLVDERAEPVVAGLLSAVAAVVAAYVLFPRDPSPPGALAPSAIVLAAGIVAIPVLRVLSGAASMTNAENFVALGYVGWLLLDLIQGAYDLRDATDEGLRKAMLAVGLSAAVMWMSTAGRAWQLPRWLAEGAGRHLDIGFVARAVPVCFALGMFNYAYSVDFDIPEMFSYLGEQRWEAPWGRGQLGGWEAFRDQAPYFGYVLPSLTALLIARYGLFRFQSLFAVFCSTIMLLFLSQGGGRRIIAVTVGAAMLVWLQLHPGLRVKNMAIIGVGLVALAWVMQFMLNIRTAGYQEFLLRGSEYDYLHVDDNYLRLAQIIDLVPARRPFVRLQQVTFTLVRPVPRFFWPGKPVNPGFDLPTEVGMKGVSLSSSIVGEWYLSFGWWTVVFGAWLHGRLATAANGLRRLGQQSGNPIVFGLSVMVLLSGMRSMQDLVLMSYALVAWWAISRLVSRDAQVGALAR